MLAVNSFGICWSRYSLEKHSTYSTNGQQKELNENKNLDCVISLIYRLGFDISWDSFCGRDHPTIPSCSPTLFDLRRDPLYMAACSRRSCTDCRELEIHCNRWGCPATGRQWTRCMGRKKCAFWHRGTHDLHLTILACFI